MPRFGDTGGDITREQLDELKTKFQLLDQQFVGAAQIALKDGGARNL